MQNKTYDTLVISMRLFTGTLLVYDLRKVNLIVLLFFEVQRKKSSSHFYFFHFTLVFVMTIYHSVVEYRGFNDLFVF